MWCNLIFEKAWHDLWNIVYLARWSTAQYRDDVIIGNDDCGRVILPGSAAEMCLSFEFVVMLRRSLSEDLYLRRKREIETQRYIARKRRTSISSSSTGNKEDQNIDIREVIDPQLAQDIGIRIKLLRILLRSLANSHEWSARLRSLPSMQLPALVFRLRRKQVFSHSQTAHRKSFRCCRCDLTIIQEEKSVLLDHMQSHVTV